MTLPAAPLPLGVPCVDHGAKLHDIPDDHLTELLPIAKKIAQAVGCDNYNILQVSSPPSQDKEPSDLLVITDSGPALYVLRTMAGSHTRKLT